MRYVSNCFVQSKKPVCLFPVFRYKDLSRKLSSIYRFSCRYLTGRNAFLKLAPLKIEEMYLDPDIILFHEILSENEMELIKQMARPRVWSSVRKDVRFIKTGGERIATVMFYMSDVLKGGATVFPELGVSVSPVKGKSIYWSNLNGAGELDAAMLHAGCPALLGSKWVSNKWIHEYGQDFQRCKYYQMKRKIQTKTSRDQQLFEEYKTNHKAAKQIKHRQRNEQ